MEDRVSALLAEKEDLTRKLLVRERVGTGYQQNCAAIRARLAEIDLEISMDPATDGG